eukprot:jgi/Tetstr1/427220/TSEL_017408.t1
MLARFEDVGVDFTPSTWAVAYADHVARCFGGDSNHAAHEWAAHGLSDICHDVKSALGVGVQILTDPSVLVSLPKGSDGRPADVGLFGYGGIRGNTVAVDTTIAPILGVSSSDRPTTALRAAERHKIQKYDEGVRNAASMLRFVPFAVSEFGSLAPHAEAFLVELAKASQAHTGQKIGQLLRLSAWRRRFSLLINMAHADNVLGGVAAARAARDGVPSRGGRRHRASVVAHAVAGALRVTIDRGEGFNSRQLFAGIEINAPAEVVWQALTNYAGLQEFIPGLKENTVVEKRSDGALLRQVGQEDLALGVKFTASVLLDIKEHRRGMPASMASADEDGKVALPVPQSWGGVHASNYMDITFELVDGDFKVFNGVWRMSPGATGPSSSRLSYTVLVQPSPWLPVRLVEGRVSGEIANNLKAVRAYAERKHKEAKSSQVAAASMAME